MKFATLWGGEMAKKETPKMFNSFIQSWNVIFFLMLTAGGIYLLYAGNYAWGAALTVVGLGGTYFCGRMVRRIMDYEGDVETGFDKLKRKREEEKLRQAAEAADGVMKNKAE